jgi:hypothetical protein
MVMHGCGKPCQTNGSAGFRKCLVGTKFLTVKWLGQCTVDVCALLRPLAGQNPEAVLAMAVTRRLPGVTPSTTIAIR